MSILGNKRKASVKALERKERVQSVTKCKVANLSGRQKKAKLIRLSLPVKRFAKGLAFHTDGNIQRSPSP